ncbi:hypothetical protein ACG0Z6_06525 [Roseateles sp. BYS180W]|uniref:Uncharacterized protein n=1 Tax=Roseateles rivi TaxID=3299028 RepID=A0ABW7FUA0_9BURK
MRFATHRFLTWLTVAGVALAAVWLSYHVQQVPNQPSLIANKAQMQALKAKAGQTLMFTVAEASEERH